VNEQQVPPFLSHDRPLPRALAWGEAIDHCKPFDSERGRIKSKMNARYRASDAFGSRLGLRVPEVRRILPIIMLKELNIIRQSILDARVPSTVTSNIRMLYMI
jgi:hypothetical protein